MKLFNLFVLHHFDSEIWCYCEKLFFQSKEIQLRWVLKYDVSHKAFLRKNDWVQIWRFHSTGFNYLKCWNWNKNLLENVIVIGSIWKLIIQKVFKCDYLNHSTAFVHLTVHHKFKDKFEITTFLSASTKIK